MKYILTGEQVATLLHMKDEWDAFRRRALGDDTLSPEDKEVYFSYELHKVCKLIGADSILKCIGFTTEVESVMIAGSVPFDDQLFPSEHGLIGDPEE